MNDDESKPHYGGLIYRYRRFIESGLASQELENILLDRVLWFSSVSSFNDPFDCLPVYTHSEISLADALRRGARYMERKEIDPASQEGKTLRHRIEAGVLNSPTRRDATLALAIERMKHDVSICCLSEKWDVPSMWAHYAADHSGYCVGIEQFGWSPTCAPLPVKYVDQRPLVDLAFDYLSDAQAANELVDKKMFLKARCWEHEREYRIVRLNRSPSHQPIPVGAIREVLLGAKIEQKHRERVIRAARNSVDQFRIYQLHPHPQSYSFTKELL